MEKSSVRPENGGSQLLKAYPWQHQWSRQVFFFFPGGSNGHGNITETGLVKGWLCRALGGSELSVMRVCKCNLASSSLERF